jgi:hypothetical protein
MCTTALLALRADQTHRRYPSAFASSENLSLLDDYPTQFDSRLDQRVDGFVGRLIRQCPVESLQVVLRIGLKYSVM